VIRLYAIFAVAVVTVMGAAATAQSPVQLAAGPGQTTVVAVCSGCHAPTLVVGRRQTKVEWKKMVESMVDRGAQADDAQVAEIVDYLFANYGYDPAAK